LAEALSIIEAEHRGLGAVLSCLAGLVDDVERRRSVPDLAVFHAIVNYLDGFLDRCHHPKEDRWLFPAVLRRAPEAAGIVTALEREHERGAVLLRTLREALAEYEYRGREAFPAFRDAAREYLRFERDHAYREERELLPLARRCLTEEDWRGIDAAFRENADPLFGPRPEREYRDLYKLIANRAPAPWGAGRGWNADR